MTCYHPDIRLADLHKYGDGKKSRTIKFIKGNSKKFPGYEFYEEQNKIFKELGEEKEYQKCACRKCAGCQEKYSKEWAIRCMYEAQQWKENYFITLTYNDANLPFPEELIDTRTGEIFEDDGTWDKPSLVPEHVEKFRHALRDYWRNHYNHRKDIRFFLCGEYGGQTHRPHYHIIAFNLPIKKADLKVYKMTKDTVLWECPIIEKIWGKGFVTVAEVNWDTCAYTARYVMKKQKGIIPREIYFQTGIEPEFIRMSTKTGIGLEYFKQNYESIYKNDEIIIHGHKGKISHSKPPSYYDKLYDLIEPEEMEKVKNQRKEIAKRANDAKNAQTSLPEAERLKVEERTKQKKWNSLKRDKI